jgi:hypothetical protein
MPGMSTTTDTRHTDWTYRTTLWAPTAADAVALAESTARRDVPDATSVTVEYTHTTATGRHSLLVTVAR